MENNTSFTQGVASVGLNHGLTIEDIRSACKQIGETKKYQIVQVSDEWCVALENGEPVGRFLKATLDSLPLSLARATEDSQTKDDAIKQKESVSHPQRSEGE